MFVNFNGDWPPQPEPPPRPTPPRLDKRARTRFTWVIAFNLLLLLLMPLAGVTLFDAVVALFRG
ncbi:hypothetical protein [Sphingomonas sp. IW22]|uniref:hypothetical protein n=1 Tax=Sphingomonas sp. IW22 TaxID=3242489 RepID=UPI0035204FAE